MKLKVLFFVLFLSVAVNMLSAQDITVATYNIRNDNSGDVKNGNGWTKRMPYVCDLIKYHRFDLFGTQEGLYNQLEDMKNNLVGFDYIGVGRDDGKQAGEYSAIFYNTDKFELIDSGNFWLSTDWTKPNMGWDAACIRVCTWGKFKEIESKKEFVVFNLHMDHIGVEARRESAKLILSKVKEIAGKLPVLVMGDFNVDQNNESYTLFDTSGIMRDAYELSPVKYINNGTFNDFNINECTNERIDHIFVGNSFKVNRYGMLTDLYWDEEKTPRLPSDHYPIVLNLVFDK